MEIYPTLQKVIEGFKGNPLVGLSGRFFREGDQIAVIPDGGLLPKGVDDTGKFSYGGFHDRPDERGLILHGVLPGREIEFEGIRVERDKEGYQRLAKDGTHRVRLPLTSLRDRQETADIVATTFPDVKVTYTYREP